jgi:hypothetical protein
LRKKVKPRWFIFFLHAQECETFRNACRDEVKLSEREGLVFFLSEAIETKEMAILKNRQREFE